MFALTATTRKLTKAALIRALRERPTLTVTNHVCPPGHPLAGPVRRDVIHVGSNHFQLSLPDSMDDHTDGRGSRVDLPSTSNLVAVNGDVNIAVEWDGHDLVTLSFDDIDWT